jgi:alpha-N-arabinofuranosidase
LHGLGIAAGVHQFIRDSDVLGLAAYAPAIGRRGAVWVTRDGACLTAAGHVLSLYRNHFGTSAVAVREDCAPLDVVAAWTADPAVLTIGVVNPLEEDTDIEIAVKDGRPLSPGTSWVVSAPDLAAYNVPGREEMIACQERPVNYRDGILACPRLSAGVYCFRVV